VIHASEVGWDAISNGRLIAAAAQVDFEVLVTIDKRMQHQQNEAKLPIPVIVLRPRTNQWRNVMALVPAAAKLLEQPSLERRFHLIEDIL